VFAPGCSVVPSRDPPDSARWRAASAGKSGKGSCSSAPSQEEAWWERVCPGSAAAWLWSLEGRDGAQSRSGPPDGWGRQSVSGCEHLVEVFLCHQSCGNKPYINLAGSTALIFKKWHLRYEYMLRPPEEYLCVCVRAHTWGFVFLL